MNLQAIFSHRSLLLVCLLELSLPIPKILAADNTPQIAGGQAYTISEFAFSITPPLTWQIIPNFMGKTLVLQPEIKQEKIKDYSKPIYNRNITVALMHQPRPIDEAEAQSLRQKLEKDFGLAAGVTEFQIIEHRFIDYRSKADAVLIYTAFQLNGFAMRQMHIFVSGSTNAALLTYTDLADVFQNDEQTMTMAWNAMLSTQLQGAAPKRYEELLPIGIGAGIFLVMVTGLLLYRRRLARHQFENVEERLYSDDSADQEPNSAVSSIVSKQASRSAKIQKSESVASDLWCLASAIATRSEVPLHVSKKNRSAISSY